MVSPSVIDSAIDRFGENVTIRVVSGTISEWGDSYNESTSDSVVIAVINDISGDEDFNKDGKYVPGDKIFYLKSSVSVDVGNRIISGGETFEVKSVIKPRLQGQDFVREVRTSKIA